MTNGKRYFHQHSKHRGLNPCFLRHHGRVDGLCGDNHRIHDPVQVRGLCHAAQHEDRALLRVPGHHGLRHDLQLRLLLSLGG